MLLRIRGDSPELNTASPKIRVEALGEDLEGLLMISEFVPWLAGFLGLVGVIILILPSEPNFAQIALCVTLVEVSSSAKQVVLGFTRPWLLIAHS